MPFCRVCGEYHLDDEMATDDTCVYCDATLIHNNQENKDNDFEDSSE